MVRKSREAPGNAGGLAAPSQPLSTDRVRTGKFSFDHSIRE